MSDSENYAQRIQRVCDYIYAHLDETLSLDCLSKIAHFSKYHFHRQFAEYTGITLNRFVQLMRLRRASYRLAFDGKDKIIDIALDAKFENPESFSRAFKNVFGQTPSQFRESPQWPEWQQRFQFDRPVLVRDPNMKVKIVDFQETQVAVLEHRGPADRVLESAAKFIEWRKQSGLSPVKTSNTYGIAYDDPKTTEPSKFRYDVCGSINGEVPDNPQGVKSGTIPAGRCAVLRHKGSHENIADSVHYLYGEWLPESGEELRDFPCYFHYLNLLHEVAEHDLETDVYLPLK